MLANTSELNGALDARLADRLATVEQRFRAELHSDQACVNELVGHVERYRGKMLRPMLTVLASLAYAAPAENSTVQSTDTPETPSAERVDLLATVFEMVHMSTLVHDDVLDEADVRRKGLTVNRLEGNEAAVMLGDYLISHAYHLCCSLDDARLAKAVAATTNTVCEGELLQLSRRGDFAMDARTYFEIVRRKTASLTAACCALPAMLLEAVDPASVEALRAYGEKVGIAFQIIDDVLDLVGDEQTVGKSLGRDLAKGKLTLPLILWLEGLDDSAEANGTGRAGGVALLEAAAAGGDPGELRERVRGSGAIDAAQSRAADLVADAQAALVGSVPAGEARDRLEALASAVLTRRR